MRRLLKFPPVEDVSSIISMAQGYLERVLSGKGVTVPQALADAHQVKSKEDPKPQAVLITPITEKFNYAEIVNDIVGILQDQVEK